MRTQDLEESEDIEDRRDEEPASEQTGVEKQARAIADTASAIYNSEDKDSSGGLADEGGYDDIPRVSKWEQTKGVFAKAFAAGGPVSSLKRIDKHPIFPNVRIVHARMRGLVASSPDLKTITINAAVPTTINVNGKRVPTAAPLAVRELYTRAGCEVFREAAQKHGHVADEQDIHACGDVHAGQVAEKQFLREHYQFNDNDLAAYAQIMKKVVGDAGNGAPNTLTPPQRLGRR